MGSATASPVGRDANNPSQWFMHSVANGSCGKRRSKQGLPEAHSSSGLGRAPWEHRNRVLSTAQRRLSEMVSRSGLGTGNQLIGNILNSAPGSSLWAGARLKASELASYRFILTPSKHPSGMS